MRAQNWYDELSDQEATMRLIAWLGMSKGRKQSNLNKAMLHLLRDFEDQVELELYEQDDKVLLSSTQLTVVHEEEMRDDGAPMSLERRA